MPITFLTVKKSQTLTMSYEFFIITGLQRTGTNWVQSLLVSNFHSRIGNKYYDHWKHLTPLGGHPQKWRSEMDLSRLTLREDVLYVATSKPFEMWCDSVNRFGANYYITHNHSQDVSVENPETTGIAQKEIWEAWESWKQDQIGKPNFYYHTYVDWLKNWQTYIQEVQDIAGWKRRTDEWINPSRVSNSPNFDITRYIKDG